MSKQIIELNNYNEQTSAFEPCAVKTTAEAVEFDDGESLDIKVDDINTQLTGLLTANASIVISEDPPDNPVDRQLWIKPVASDS